MLVQRRGQANLSTWAFFAVLLGLLYAAVIFVPAWLDNLSVKEAVEVAFTRGYSVSDDQLAEVVILRLNTGPTAVGYHFEEDDDGRRVEVPGLGLTIDDVTVDRDELTRTLTITVDYVRELRLKPTSRLKRLHFRVEKAQSFK